MMYVMCICDLDEIDVCDADEDDVDDVCDVDENIQTMWMMYVM